MVGGRSARALPPDFTSAIPFMSSLSILDVDAVRAAPVAHDPYRYFLGRQVLRPEAIADAIRSDKPHRLPMELVVRILLHDGAFDLSGCPDEPPVEDEEAHERWEQRRLLAARGISNAHIDRADAKRLRGVPITCRCARGSNPRPGSCHACSPLTPRVPIPRTGRRAAHLRGVLPS